MSANVYLELVSGVSFLLFFPKSAQGGFSDLVFLLTAGASHVLSAQFIPPSKDFPGLNTLKHVHSLMLPPPCSRDSFAS